MRSTFLILAAALFIASCQKDIEYHTCQHDGAPYQFDNNYKELNYDSCTCPDAYEGTYCELEKRSDYYGTYTGTFTFFYQAQDNVDTGSLYVEEGANDNPYELYIYADTGTGKYYVSNIYLQTHKDELLNEYSDVGHRLNARGNFVDKTRRTSFSFSISKSIDSTGEYTSFKFRGSR